MTNTPDPVYHPSVPDKVRALLDRHRDVLAARRGPRPPRRYLSEAWFLPLLLTVLGFSIGISIAVPAGLVIGLSSETAAWIAGGVIVLVSTAAPFPGTRWKSDFYRTSLEKHRSAKSARRFHGMYFTAQDYDPVTGDLLCRAQNAVRQVVGSQVHADGLLDAAPGKAVLDHRLYDLAEALFNLAVLRREQQDAGQKPMTPELESVLEPRRRALQSSLETLEARVARLEDYAGRVAKAESIHTAHRLTQRTPDYKALLTDASGTPDLERLTDRARDLETALSAALHDAIEAGQAILAPGDRRPAPPLTPSPAAPADEPEDVPSRDPVPRDEAQHPEETRPGTLPVVVLQGAEGVAVEEHVCTLEDHGSGKWSVGWHLVYRNRRRNALPDLPKVHLTVRDAEGRVLGTDCDVLSKLPPLQREVRESGTTVKGRPARLEIEIRHIEWIATSTHPEQYLVFPIGNTRFIRDTDGWQFTGEVTNPYPADIGDLQVMAVARDESGDLVDTGFTFTGRVPAGRAVPFGLSGTSVRAAGCEIVCLPWSGATWEELAAGVPLEGAPAPSGQD